MVLVFSILLKVNSMKESLSTAKCMGSVSSLGLMVQHTRVFLKITRWMAGVCTLIPTVLNSKDCLRIAK
jgi:hypothetical protein